MTGRKSGTSVKPDGEGWEPNDIVPCDFERDPAGALIWDADDQLIPIAWRNWQRFDYTEEEYWRRKVNR